MERIEIFTGEQRRRRYTPQEKAKFVAMTMQPGYSVSLVASFNCPDCTAFERKTVMSRNKW